MTGFKDVNKIKVAQLGCKWWAGVKEVMKVRGPTHRESCMQFLLVCVSVRKSLQHGIS